MGVEIVKSMVEKGLSKYRKLYYIVMQESFEEVYNTLTEEDKKKVHDYIIKMDADGLRNLLAPRHNSMLCLKTVRELRILASKMGVVGYTQLSKVHLVSKLRAREFLNG